MKTGIHPEYLEASVTCACGNTFPVEYNSRGQITSRKLCDRCREKRNTRTTRALPSTRGVPRCIDCTALVGPQWGTVTHLDPNGRCPSCSNWYQKRTYIAERERMGYRFVGGMFGVTQNQAGALAPEFGWGIVHDPRP